MSDRDHSRDRDRDGDRPRDRFPDGSNPETAGPDSWLSNLLTALDRLENVSRSGSRGRRSTLDYDVSIRTGLSGLGQERSGAGPADPDRAQRSGSGRSEPSNRNRERSRRSRRVQPSSNDYLVTTRTHEDELLVTADVSNVDPDDVTVGFDDGTLVVGVAGTELERVRVPWDETSARALVRNGVLTVTVEPESGSDVKSDPDPDPDSGSGSGSHAESGTDAGEGSERETETDDEDEGES